MTKFPEGVDCVGLCIFRSQPEILRGIRSLNNPEGFYIRDNEHEDRNVSKNQQESPGGAGLIFTFQVQKKTLRRQSF